MSGWPQLPRARRAGFLVGTVLASAAALAGLAVVAGLLSAVARVSGWTPLLMLAGAVVLAALADRGRDATHITRSTAPRRPQATPIPSPPIDGAAVVAGLLPAGPAPRRIAEELHGIEHGLRAAAGAGDLEGVADGLAQLRRLRTALYAASAAPPTSAPSGEA